MPKGRKPVPSRVKLFKASRRAKSSGHANNVRKPGTLEGKASDEWDRLAPDLIKDGRLTEGNLALFLNLCNLAAVVETCKESLASEGPVVSTAAGNDKQNPAAPVMMAAMAEQRRLHDKFGLLVAPKVSSEEDAFEAFLGESG